MYVLINRSIFKQCVDAGPSKRPTDEYLHETWKWLSEKNSEEEKYGEVYKQIKAAEEFNEKPPSFTKLVNTELTYTTHPQAFYTSK
ncbi:hypothetical protein C1645_813566 [Glomus cerebriforme]|uniref:Uncharacterized protein n=1 Tax=Glomus cerebriforme TaxID=658196 RepID=A0A397TKE0_9GLOM|nr:hypothetical protein C1645_813566 [Glomus cerebriforme]